jgi:hypothetical protein
VAFVFTETVPSRLPCPFLRLLKRPLQPGKCRAAEAARIWLAVTAKLDDSDDEQGDVDDEVGNIHDLALPSSGVTQEGQSPTSASNYGRRPGCAVG